MTSLCLRLLTLDFAAAFWANPVVMILLPFILAFLIYASVCYVLAKGPQVKSFAPMIWGCVIVLLLWGVIRNILHI